MRTKIYDFLVRVYSYITTAAFFAGGLPIIPFIVALCIGGDIGAAMIVFIYKQYYPAVIIAASVGIIIGIVAMYIGGKSALTMDSEMKHSDKKKRRHHHSIHHIQ